MQGFGGVQFAGLGPEGLGATTSYIIDDRPMYLSIYLSMYVSVYLSICLSVYLSTYLSVNLSIYRHICVYNLHTAIYDDLLCVTGGDINPGLPYRPEPMGIMVYSLFWVMQDLYHQP